MLSATPSASPGEPLGVGRPNLAFFPALVCAKTGPVDNKIDKDKIDNKPMSPRKSAARER